MTKYIPNMFIWTAHSFLFEKQFFSFWKLSSLVFYRVNSKLKKFFDRACLFVAQFGVRTTLTTSAIESMVRVSVLPGILDITSILLNKKRHRSLIQRNQIVQKWNWRPPFRITEKRSIRRTLLDWSRAVPAASTTNSNVKQAKYEKLHVWATMNTREMLHEHTSAGIRIGHKRRWDTLVTKRMLTSAIYT